ncbi:Pre-rRNA-processing protein ipi3, partial [Cladochytrium tenue]
EQELTKFVLPERLRCMQSSRSGCYMIGGGESGRIYVWELGTGGLLRSADAHFKPVTAVSFAMDDSAFVTCSDDASAHVWLSAG